MCLIFFPRVIRTVTPSPFGASEEGWDQDVIPSTYKEAPSEESKCLNMFVYLCTSSLHATQLIKSDAQSPNCQIQNARPSIHTDCQPGAYHCSPQPSPTHPHWLHPVALPVLSAPPALFFSRLMFKANQALPNPFMKTCVSDANPKFFKVHLIRGASSGGLGR